MAIDLTNSLCNIVGFLILLLLYFFQPGRLCIYVSTEMVMGNCHALPSEIAMCAIIVSRQPP